MHRITRWFSDAEAWLDARGKGAWIAAMVIAFIAFWPIGLALLAYMFWSNRMTCSARRWSHTGARFRSSGNSAFDAYRDDTLKRLEDEQNAFQSFLERLRRAKDQAEFDQFMDDAKRRGEGRPEESPA
ncbi:DUF2852 domain-containing protein [Halovulum dunhuangense]|uniref:DUF2852 domain-containing protein n=1 Tax=Halovulum dunhuangense TaxID=1505036 RepID=A0A849L2S7_9RHOB|nr:DUF2852 domain-containing protein [Halovulum dunhuangense]NNU80517.1 DUF2852 domain-containing protein [Halovulum dunhuangense]